MSTDSPRGENYLSGYPNPYALTGPPSWFLDDLWTFDRDLVIFPSQEEPVYRVGRRVTHGPNPWRLISTVTAPDAQTRSPLFQRRPDTAVMAHYRLVPVTSLLPSPYVQWGPVILQDLAACDLHRRGGADRVCDDLEAAEDAAARKDRRDTEEDIGVMARAAYRGHKWATGQTIDLGAHRTRSGLFVPTPNSVLTPATA